MTVGIDQQNAALSVTIASEASVSEAIHMPGESLLAVHLPADFEGARLGFQSALAAGGSFLPVYDPATADTLYTVEAGASRVVPIPPHIAIALGPSVKLVSLDAENSAAPVTEGQTRTLSLVTRRL